MRRWLLPVALLFATSAQASSMASNRPLTEQEILLNSCALSDAVAVVRMDKFYTDFYRDKRNADGSGAMVNIGEFQVVRTLKGKLHAGSKVRVQVPNSARMGNSAMGSCGVVFLQRWRGKRNFYDAGSEGPLPVWVVYSNPEIFSRGYESVGCDEPAPLVERVRKALLDVTPEGLARLSDIVLVADVQFVGKGSIRIGEIDRAYVTIASFQQVYGSRQASGLRVMAPDYLSSGKQLLYLKKVGAGTFETVGLQAGRQAIKDGKVGDSETKLSDVLARLIREESRRQASLEAHGSVRPGY